jgi:hypothetical protein
MFLCPLRQGVGFLSAGPRFSSILRDATPQLLLTMKLPLLPNHLTETVFGRVIVTLLTFVVIVIPLALTGLNTDPATAHTLATPLDDAIPFLPWSVLIYSWVYTSMFVPVFVVRDGEIFRRVVVAYWWVCALSIAVYLVYPVTSIHLRPDVTELDTSLFHNWIMRLTYWMDPPANLFPSLHVGTALISALGAYKARPLFGWLSAPMVVAICITICTTKQHYIVDGIFSFFVVALVWKWTLAPYRTQDIPTSQRAFTWRGPVAYAIFHCSIYALFYILFRTMGDLPW